MGEHVHDETLDVGSVVVLVGHNHNPSVTELFCVLVHLARLQTNDLLEIRYL